MTDSVDVIVVGGGGSGLAAAAEAAGLGRTVILLEKKAALGGSTALSVGSMSATNTPHQQRHGIKDSPDEHFEDLGLFAGQLAARDNLALRRILVDEANEAFRWLASHGVVFLGPALERPHRYPRMHNVVPGSKAYVYHLGRLCRRRGVDIRLSMKAESFIVEDGRVVGVAALDASGAKRRFHAQRGVVLTSGDFSGGREMKARYASKVAADCAAVNSTNTGDGHAMALAIGASLVNGDLVHGPILRFVAPEHPGLMARIPPFTWVARMAVFAMEHLPQALVRPILMRFITTVLGPDPGLFRAGAVLVNEKGERFTNEREKPAHDLVTQPNGVGYIVLDGAMADRFSAWPHFVSTAPNVAYAYLPDYKRNRQDIYHEAPGAVELARRLGMDPQALSVSLQSGGTDSAGMRRAPFIALGPVKSYIVLTDGGLKVTERHEVLGPEDKPIRGLYAAGSAGQGGLLLYGHGHHIAWAFVSGRRAGRHAALTLPS
jgi:succinate dehydrogenase/fumarate reductase flavoprotein subunit